MAKSQEIRPGPSLARRATVPADSQDHAKPFRFVRASTKSGRKRRASLNTEIASSKRPARARTAPRLQYASGSWGAKPIAVLNCLSPRPADPSRRAPHPGWHELLRSRALFGPHAQSARLPPAAGSFACIPCQAEQSVGMVRLTVEKFEAQSFGTTEISGLMVPQGTWQ